MRQIALDTETTGLSTEQGHRIIEIGCVEIIDRRITDSNFHCYLDPCRQVDQGAFAIHGISNEFLKNKPKFRDINERFFNYIDGAELLIHNAPFDVGFLNYELSLLGSLKSLIDYCTIFDTLTFARSRHPMQKNNLDALCKRYGIDNSHRELHGALLDADLLARLYLAMTGGQGSLFCDPEAFIQGEQREMTQLMTKTVELPILTLTPEETNAHLEFVELLKKTSGLNLWDSE